MPTPDMAETPGIPGGLSNPQPNTDDLHDVDAPAILTRPKRSPRDLDPEACRALVESERWQRRITITESGCWLTSYATTRPGYAVVKVGGRSVIAHRVVLVAALGRDLLPGMQAGHGCHDRAYAAGECTATATDPCEHRRCVNPAHLAEQTPRDNVLAGGTPAADRAARAYCPAGHPLVGPEADLVAADLRRGRRNCRRCDLACSAAVRAAHRGLGLTFRAYGSRFGWSRAVAEGILARLAAGETPASILADRRAVA